MNKCYECIYRSDIPGDAHSRCKHPAVGISNPLNELFSILGSVGRVPNNISAGPAQKLNIKGNPTGIKNGWFNWPYNFDPTWLVNCDGFTQKEKANK